jgi:CRISPR-associated endonuclease/helicase Cas3
LKAYFSYNGLINPKQITDVDDTDTNFWRSRNIDSQDTVFVEKPPSNYFRNYLEYQSWKIKYSIEISVYLIKKGMKQYKIDLIKIHVKDETEKIYVIREGFYNINIGADFRELEQYS